MPKTYSFVLSEDDVPTFIGTLQYNQHDLEERNRKETDVLEPEFEMNLEELRILKIIQSQYEDQLANGPMVEMSIMQAQAEALHLALVQQAAFAKRQSLSMSKLLANPSLPREERDLLYLEYKSYVAQFLVVDSLLTQVGRHL